MFKPKRLHPAAVITGGIKSLKEAIVPILILFFLDSEDDDSWVWLKFAIIGLIVLFLLFRSFISWFRFTWWIENDELRIKSGLFVKNERYIRFDRIHSIDISEGLIQRAFRLAKVRVETAGGNQADAVLDAITKEDAAAIQAVLAEAKEQKGPEAEAAEEVPAGPVFRQSFPELFLLAATSGGVGVVFSGAAAILSQMDELIPYHRVFNEFKEFAQTGALFITLVLLGGFLAAYAIAVFSIMLKYAYFILEKAEDDLMITRGLLEKRRLTIPLKKIQGIRISENLLRQPLGYCSVYAEYAGGSAEDIQNARIMLFPLIKKEELQPLLDEFVPGYLYQEEPAPLPGRAYPRYLFRQLLIALPFIAAAIFFLRPWGYLALFLLPAAAAWAYLKFNSAGHKLSGEQIQVSGRIVSKYTLLLHRRRIQAMDVSGNWLQERKDLASLQVSIISGSGTGTGEVADLEKADALKVKDWFSYSGKKNPSSAGGSTQAGSLRTVPQDG